MGSGDGMMQALRTGARGARWGHVALLSLALHVRSAWLLLGVWVAAGGASSLPLLGRIRLLPTHPDWVLPSLVQSAVVAVVVVGLAGRWRTGWALVTAAVAGGVAWAVTFAWVPNGLESSRLPTIAITGHVQGEESINLLSPRSSLSPDPRRCTSWVSLVVSFWI